MKVNINLEFDSGEKKDAAVLAAIAGILAGVVDVGVSPIAVGDGDTHAVAVTVSDPTEPEAKPAPKRKGRTKTEEQKAAEAAQQEAEQKAAVEELAKQAVEALQPVAEPEPKPEVKPEPKPEPASPAVDYAKDVRPLIIKFVQATSHEHVLKWLQDNFAVQSAMKIPADYLGKAKDMLTAELEKFTE